MARPIFRKEALDQLASPEQIDHLMQLTDPRGWIALAGLGLLLLVAILWGIFGTIATTVAGHGALVRPGGVKPVNAPHAGVVAAVAVRDGQQVEKGQELLRVAPARASSAEGNRLRSPYRARVLQVAVQKGDPVENGAALVLLESRDDPLRAILYVPADEGYQVKPGDQVQLAPAPVKTSESGYLPGRVQSAAKFLATRAAMMRSLQNEELVNSLAGAGPSLEVVVELTGDAASTNGSPGSSSAGAALELYSGTPCRALITVRTQRPINLVLPGLGQRRGP